MRVKEFIAGYQPKFSEYCPCVIDWQGEVYECKTSHLDELIRLGGDEDILSELPKELSPLFYLIDRLRSVAVDYENQIYSGELSAEQKEALQDLAEAGLITMSLTNIHGKITI